MLNMSKKKVMIFGTYDNLHPGHLDFFKQARQYGDELIAVIARDQNVKKFKGHYPRQKENERAKSVRECRLVDTVILGHFYNPYKVIEDYRPDVICLGYDQDSYSEKLEKLFPEITIVRLKPFEPHIYKSSLRP